MLKQKKKKCKDCGQLSFIFSKGLCQKCAEKTSKGLKSNSSIKSSVKRIKPITEKKIEEKKTTKEKRDKYFDYHIKNCTVSEESGTPIPNPTKSNICHLFPKRNHPSLEDNLENCILLTFKEHERFDYLLYSYRFEKIEEEFKNSWNIVCFRLKSLLYLCEENTVFTRKVKEYLDGRKT